MFLIKAEKAKTAENKESFNPLIQVYVFNSWGLGFKEEHDKLVLIP